MFSTIPSTGTRSCRNIMMSRVTSSKGVIGVSSFFVGGVIGVSSFFVEKSTDTIILIKLDDGTIIDEPDSWDAWSASSLSKLNWLLPQLIRLPDQQLRASNDGCNIALADRLMAALQGSSGRLFL